MAPESLNNFGLIYEKIAPSKSFFRSILGLILSAIALLILFRLDETQDLTLKIVSAVLFVIFFIRAFQTRNKKGDVVLRIDLSGIRFPTQKLHIPWSQVSEVRTDQIIHRNAPRGPRILLPYGPIKVPGGNWHAALFIFSDPKIAAKVANTAFGLSLILDSKAEAELLVQACQHCLKK